MAIGIDNAFTSTRTPLLNAAEPTASKRRLFRAVRSFWRTGTSTEEIVTCSGMLNAELFPQFSGYLLIVTNSPMDTSVSEAGCSCTDEWLSGSMHCVFGSGSKALASREFESL